MYDDFWLIYFFRDEVETLFNERDRDRDGSLSFQEFMGQETQMEKAFRMMDKDGDGFVTKTEFKKVCKNLTKEQVEAAFNKFDAAGNGKLNYIEFCDMMNRRKLNQAKQKAVLCLFMLQYSFHYNYKSKYFRNNLQIFSFRLVFF